LLLAAKLLPAQVKTSIFTGILVPD